MTRWLEELGDPNTKEERIEKLYKKVVSFRMAVTLVYKEKDEEVLKGIKDHRVEVMPKILARMNQKL